jgi:hypothetical protein
VWPSEPGSTAVLPEKLHAQTEALRRKYRSAGGPERLSSAPVDDGGMLSVPGDWLYQDHEKVVDEALTKQRVAV